MKLLPITYVDEFFDDMTYTNMQEYYFYCPGCKTAHKIRTNGPSPNWQFNGNHEKPTFSPSYLCGGHTYNKDGSTKEKFSTIRCHSFIRDGQIQFLDDCHHELKGQTVPLPEIPDWLKD